MTTPWSQGNLARWGFLDTSAALDRAARLTDLGPDVAELVVPACARAADPDQALATLVGWTETAEGGPALLADDGCRRRLVAVAGASAELGRWLVARPQDVATLRPEPRRWTAEELRGDLAAAVAVGPAESPTSPSASSASPSVPPTSPSASPTSLLVPPASLSVPPAGPSASSASPPDALRHAYRRHVLRIAARDLTADDPAALLEDITGELADLADATVEAALDIARQRVPGAEGVRLAVIALGKTGGQELNYASDVDLVYVAEPARDPDGQPALPADQAIAVATRWVAAMTEVCSAVTTAGTIWPIDANLRPEGAVGPLVRSLQGMRGYYGKWAHNWEFQAMLKARPMAGDLALGEEFLGIVSPEVWTAAQRPHFLAEAQAMRRRVMDHLPAKEAGRDVKLGSGGLRDTEFAVQLLQLVHGRTDERLRLKATLPALRALTDHGYIGRADGLVLDGAYRFQRLVEHRLQLWRLSRTHLMPEDDDVPALRRLARSLGLASPEEVLGRWRETARSVRHRRRRVFYSPLLEAVARLPGDQVRLTTVAARDRLQALGYGDPAAALRHIEALTAGLSRRAEIQRQILPALLGWIADGPNPDWGLLAFRQVSDIQGNSSFYLRALRDEGAMAERLARVLSSSRYVTNLLLRSPAAVELLAHEEIAPVKGRDELVAEMTAARDAHGGEAPADEAFWAVRRRELARVAMADLLGQADLGRVGRELSDVADASVEAALLLARREVPRAPELAVIALGRWGGREMCYSSDADLMFVVEDSADSEALRLAAAVVAALRRRLATAGPNPGLELDVDLRPEGKDGPLVRTLESCRRYYSRWSSPWESQALIRARAAAGSRVLGEGLIDSIASLRYPAGGVTTEQLLSMRRLKGRMEAERLPRGRAHDHVKLGRGGLADVEWTVQLVQLQHADAVPALRTPSTVEALAAAREAGLVAPQDASDLAEAWQLASRVRNAITLVRDKASDVVPADAVQAGQVAQVLGYGQGQASQLAEDWGQVALRSRRVVDRLFWGLEE